MISSCEREVFYGKDAINAIIDKDSSRCAISSGGCSRTSSGAAVWKSRRSLTGVIRVSSAAISPISAGVVAQSSRASSSASCRIKLSFRGNSTQRTDAAGASGRARGTDIIAFKSHAAGPASAPAWEGRWPHGCNGASIGYSNSSGFSTCTQAGTRGIGGPTTTRASFEAIYEGSKTASAAPASPCYDYVINSVSGVVDECTIDSRLAPIGTSSDGACPVAPLPHLYFKSCIDRYSYFSYWTGSRGWFDVNVREALPADAPSASAPGCVSVTTSAPTSDCTDRVFFQPRRRRPCSVTKVFDDGMLSV